MGKLRAIAKGARKPRSRKAGHLEPFTRVTLQLARGRATGPEALLLVTQAETLDAYLPLHEELSLATYASYVVELLDRFTYEEGQNRTLYRLLVDTLQRLSASLAQSLGNDAPREIGGALPMDLVVRFYEMRLLDLVGFRPELFYCLGCKQPIQAQNQYFSAEKGGALCPKCGLQVPEAKPVSTDVLRYLRHFQRSNWVEAVHAPLTASLNRELEMIIHYYLTYLLERGLNTPRFIREIRKTYN
jgi:DNA repair protein RecO (recombination protein O)